MINKITECCHAPIFVDKIKGRIVPICADCKKICVGYGITQDELNEAWKKATCHHKPSEQTIRKAFKKAIEEPRCPECGAKLKSKAVLGIDMHGDDYDFEGYVCPNGCRLEGDQMTGKKLIQRLKWIRTMPNMLSMDGELYILIKELEAVR